MAVVEIPLVPQPQKFAVDLAGTSYFMRLTWDEAGAFWALDLADNGGALLLAGVPLVTGSDLLAQYAYLDIGGSLILTTDRGAGEVPAYDALGVTSHLYFVT